MAWPEYILQENVEDITVDPIIIEELNLALR
jgi:hypothetical protein